VWALFAVTVSLPVPTRAAAAEPIDLPTLHAVTPARIVDTRATGTTVDGRYRGMGPVGEEAVFTFPVAGRGGVPETGVGAVVLNVTATEPSAATFLTVYRATSPRSTASNLNAEAAQTVANTVVVEVGYGGPTGPGRTPVHPSDNGLVNVYNRFGSVHVVVDVLGWFPADGFTGVGPARLADTRTGAPTVDGAHSGAGAVGAGEVRRVPVAGRAGVPTGATAVAVNLTAVAPDAATFLTAFPSGSSRPTASNVNAVAGTVVPGLVIVPLAGGAIDVYNAHGNAHAVVDVLGYFAPGTPMAAIAPARVADTRIGGHTVDGRFSGYRAINGGQVLDVVVAGRADVPADAGAVALRVAVTEPTNATYVTVYPAGQAKPEASNVNAVPGRTQANTVIVPVGNSGQVSMYQAFGSAHIVVDVLAWFPNPTDPSTVYGNTTVLRGDGIGTAGFGSEAGTVVDVVRQTLGPPSSDETYEFPNREPGDPYYYDDIDYARFEYPFERVVCWYNRWTTFCAAFGGTDPATLRFSGWRTYGGGSRLYTAEGIGIDSRPADFPGVIAYSAGGCRDELALPSRQALGRVGVDGIVAELRSVTPFGEYEGGRFIPRRPAESDVRVWGLHAGTSVVVPRSLPYPADCSL